MIVILNWFRNLFKFKSPCCKAIMNQNNLHINNDYSENFIYECSTCNKQFI
jgi:hypothetical protein